VAGKGDTFEADLLKLIFQAVAIANIADNAASAPLTSLYVALHSTDPGETGTQTSGEVTTGAYTGYARVGVARTTGGWAITGSVISPVADIVFPACTGGTGVTANFLTIGTASTGTGKMLYFGPLSPPIPISNGTTPRITTGTQITED
jgi:hypothetical protein